MRERILILLTLLILLSPLVTEAQDMNQGAAASAEPVPRLISSSLLPAQILSVWQNRQDLLSQGNFEGSEAVLGVIQNLKEQQGIQNLNRLSQVLLWEATEAVQKGEISKANVLAAAAEKLSPDYPPVYFFNARFAWREHPLRIFENFGKTLTAWRVSLSDFWFSLNGIRTVFVTLFLALLIALLSLLIILLLRSVPLLSHSIWEWSSRYLHRYNRWGLILVILFLPLLLGMKPFWSILLWMSLVWFWLRRVEQFLLTVTFFCIVAVLYTAPYWTFLFIADNDRQLQLIVDTARGEWISPARIEEKEFDQASWQTLFASASIKKREGHCDEAIPLYHRLEKIVTSANANRAMVLNNLGNCYFYQKEYTKAINAYEEAIHQFPSSVIPYYNISQTYREELLFDKGDEYYKKAVQRDKAKVSHYSHLSTLGTHYQVIDQIYGLREIWRKALHVKDDLLAQSVWSLFVGDIPKGQATLIMSLWLGWMLFLSLRGPSFKNVLKCQICSKIICKMCQHHFLDLTTCAECWNVLKTKGGRPPMVEGRRGIPKHLRLPVWMMTLLIPGSGHLLLHKSIKGVGLILFFSFILSIFILNRIPFFIVADNISDSVGGITGSLFPWLLLYLIFYIATLFDLKKELQS